MSNSDPMSNQPANASPDEGQAPASPEAPGHGAPPHVRRRSRGGEVHLLFGAVEDMLADLRQHGAPDDQTVRVERIVRTRPHQLGGNATLGITVTARRADEILSCWVVVGRLSLDPWGQPMNRSDAHAAAERHRTAQHVVGALVADAGFEVRLGLYLLPDSAYGFAATCAALEPAPAGQGQPVDTSTTTSGPAQAVGNEPTTMHDDRHLDTSEPSSEGGAPHV